jgi:FKBP-type peptidyl-prolyl cis-trans isomerase
MRIKQYYNGVMSTKSIVIGVVILIILAIGAYFITQKTSPIPANTNAAAQSQTSAAAASATSTEQVQAQEVTAGSGAQAAPGSNVSVLYVGKLQDGTVFDSSQAHGNQPLTFTLGSQGLIAGFQIGVNGMKEGGERLIAVPPSLGYGSQDVKDSTGKVIIPANSTLVFDIKLVKVGAADTAAPAKKK